MPQAPSSAPNAGTTGLAGAGVSLDGEVIPPSIRVLNPAREPDPETSASPTARHIRLSTALLAGALVATLSGTGAFEAYRWHVRGLHAASARPSPTAMALAQLNKDVGDLRAAVAAPRPDDAAKALKKSLDQLRMELDGLRTAQAASVTQLSAKVEARAAAPGPAVADVVARLDKLDRDPRLADIASRLDRIERQVSSPTPTGSIVPPSKAAGGQSVVTQAVAAPPPAAKSSKAAVLDNWIVRDVYSGIALVEGRSGSVREVVPGELLPGAGEVQAIQRRGRGWVVVTSRGIINTETW